MRWRHFVLCRALAPSFLNCSIWFKGQCGFLYYYVAAICNTQGCSQGGWEGGQEAFAPTPCFSLTVDRVLVCIRNYFSPANLDTQKKLYLKPTLFIVTN